MNKFTNILLAEDDNDDYLFFAETLQTISPFYNVIRVKNGLDCITYLKNQPKPDLIFLDLNMPLKNGIECLKFIKDTENLAFIPVIIYSTSHYIKDIDCAFKNDAHYYIVKPSDQHQLHEVLCILFERLSQDKEKAVKGKFVVRITADMTT